VILHHVRENSQEFPVRRTLAATREMRYSGFLPSRAIHRLLDFRAQPSSLRMTDGKVS
jgi:hypothetical protein